MCSSKEQILSSIAVVVAMLLAGAFLARRQSKKEVANKLESLEGLRGVAAFAVVLWHFLEMFYPALTTGDSTCAGGPLRWVALTPLALLWSGHSAVVLFFVLSGFALSYACFSTGSSMSAVSGLARRYARLAIPVSFASCACAVLLETGLISQQLLIQLAQHTKTDFASLYGFVPSLYDALKCSLIDAFVRTFGKYNLVLWTIHYEFYGSIFVYLTLLVVLRFKNRFWLYLGAALLSRQPYYLAFLLGLILCDVLCTCPKFLSRKAAYLTIPIAIYCSGLPGWSPEHFDGTQYGWLAGAEGDRVIVVGNALILYAVLSLPGVQWLLTRNLFRYLGRISFSLYLMHLAVMFGVTSQLFLAFLPTLGYNASAGLSFVISLPVVFVVSHVVYLYIDQGSVTASKLVYNATLGRLLKRLPNPKLAKAPKPMHVSHGIESQVEEPVHALRG